MLGKTGEASAPLFQEFISFPGKSSKSERQGLTLSFYQKKALFKIFWHLEGDGK